MALAGSAEINLNSSVWLSLLEFAPDSIDA